MNSCLRVQFTDPLVLVRLYSSTTKCQTIARQLLDSLAECKYISKNAFVTCGKLVHVSQADFLPVPAKDDIVSHPVKAWKTVSAVQISLYHYKHELNCTLKTKLSQKQSFTSNINNTKKLTFNKYFVTSTMKDIVEQVSVHYVINFIKETHLQLTCLRNLKKCVKPAT